MPLGLRREEAAAYVGIGSGLFDQMVQAGTMPKPKCVNSVKIWNRYELDSAFAELPTEDQQDEWSDVGV